MMIWGDYMNWNGKDISTFIQQKEYMDTIILPLVPVTFEEGMKDAGSQYEFIQLLAMLLEKQFKGRILLLPAFSYLKDLPAESKLEDLKRWTSEIKSAGFKHVFLLTSDSEWKLSESHIEGSLIWVPAVPLEHMDDSYKYSLIEDQAKQFVNIIVHNWQQNPS